MIIRPVQASDLDDLLRLSQQTGFGLTSLPNDRELLAQRIYTSELSFGRYVYEPGSESYLFVLQDEDGQLLGSSGIKAKTGGYQPFYAYRLETLTHESRVLNVRKERRVLHLVAEHNGPSEIGSLFLAPGKRRGGGGRFLSLVRFLFMAEHAQRFEAEVIAEMRGLADADGRSPFWDSLGKLFFDIEYPVADYLSVKNKAFIGELMPKHPIYINLLSPEAQAAIGQVHEQTRGAVYLLEQEGFRPTGMVDIFDAGQMLGATVAAVRAVRSSVRGSVAELGSAEKVGGALQFVSNLESKGFRATPGYAARTPGGEILLEERVARLLGIEVGQAVRFTPARPISAPQSAIK